MRSTSTVRAPGRVGLEVPDERVELLLGSEPGTIRIESLALASGMSTFEDPAIERHVDPDRRDRRVGPQRGPDRAAPDHLGTVEHVRAGSEVLLAEVHAVPVERGHAVDRDVALVVVQGREQPREGHHRVGRGAAEHARVQGVLEGAARSRCRRRRRGGSSSAPAPPTSRLPMSQTTNRSQANSSGWASTNASRLLYVSSIPSTISLTVHGRRAVEVPERAEVDRQARPCRRRRRARRSGRRPCCVGVHGSDGPALLRRRRLHVVVRVEHHDRRPGRPLELAVDRRVAARHLL